MLRDAGTHARCEVVAGVRGVDCGAGAARPGATGTGGGMGIGARRGEAVRGVAPVAAALRADHDAAPDVDGRCCCCC